MESLTNTPPGVGFALAHPKPPKFEMMVAIEATSAFRAIANYLEVVPRMLEQAGASLDRDGVLGDILAAVEDGRTELDLSNRKLKELPPELALAGNLEVLSLGRNEFELLPASIGMLSRLEELDLTGNRLRRLPPHIGALSNLSSLLVQHNELFDLPGEIRHLQKLQYLDVSHNRLTELPGGIGWLTALRELRATDNQLRSIPRQIGYLTMLRRLAIENNQLKTLPAELARLERLKDWDFSRRDQLPPREAYGLTFHGNPLEDPPPHVRGPEIASYFRPRLGMQTEPQIHKRLPGRSLADFNALIDSLPNASVHETLEQDRVITAIIDVGNERLRLSYDDELELVWSDGSARIESLWGP